MDHLSYRWARPNNSICSQCLSEKPVVFAFMFYCSLWKKLYLRVLWSTYCRMIIAVVTVVERLADVLVSWYVKFLNPQLALCLVSSRYRRISVQKSPKFEANVLMVIVHLFNACVVFHTFPRSTLYGLKLEVVNMNGSICLCRLLTAHMFFQKIPKSCLFGRKLQ